ncbi:MAG: hypothetical protein HYV60_23650 [Planctomycetia bacterium]|nr:hypothetical protein [Planctomycetia bacterium]
MNTGRNIYRCFRCGSQGTVLDFWMSYRKLPIHAAAQELRARTSRGPDSVTSNHQSHHLSSQPARLAHFLVAIDTWRIETRHSRDPYAPAPGCEA